MRTYKLYAAVSTTANSVASVIVAKSGRIRCIRWESAFDAPADNASAYMELSTSPSTMLGVNDAVNSISELRHNTNLTTSGAFNGSRSKQEVVDYPIAAGERLYMHAICNGTVASATSITVDVDER